MRSTEHVKSCRCNCCKFERRYGRKPYLDEREVLESLDAREKAELAAETEKARANGFETVQEWRAEKRFRSASY